MRPPLPKPLVRPPGFPKPTGLPKATGPALVLGSGRSVWADLRAIDKPHVPVFAVNEMIIFAPRVDHAVSHHAGKLLHWNALRSHAGTGEVRKPRESRIIVHSSMPGTGITKTWPQFKGDGSSALLAVRIARALGHDPVYVAGVPLDGRGYVWDEPREGAFYDFARYRGGWSRVVETELRGHVFAPSGFLCELLGAGR